MPRTCLLVRVLRSAVPGLRKGDSLKAEKGVEQIDKATDAHYRALDPFPCEDFGNPDNHRQVAIEDA